MTCRARSGFHQQPGVGTFLEKGGVRAPAERKRNSRRESPAPNPAALAARSSISGISGCSGPISGFMFSLLEIVFSQCHDVCS
jgi:hypothetical protein